MSGTSTAQAKSRNANGVVASGALNDSSIIGPLRPEPSGPQPLEGQALYRFLNGWIAGVCGLPSEAIRPSWQPYPAIPPAPPSVTVWCSFQVHSRTTLGFTQFMHQGSADGGLGNDISVRQQFVELLLSFYDQGVDGQADYYASVMADGCFVTQNSELLQANGFGLLFVGDATPAPVLLKERWYYRTDLPIRMQRYLARTYPVRNLVGAVGSMASDVGFTDGLVSQP